MYDKFNNKRRFLWLKQEKVRKRFMFTHIPRKTVRRLKHTIDQPLIRAKGKNSVEHSLLLGCASRSFSLRLFYSLSPLFLIYTIFAYPTNLSCIHCGYFPQAVYRIAMTVQIISLISPKNEACLT